MVVKSSWASKINWAQGVGLLATVLAMIGIDVPAEVQAQIVAGIASAVYVVTWVLRTWFTKSLTKASVE